MSGIMPDYEGVAMTQRECYMAGREAGLAEARKSPVIPDGYVRQLSQLWGCWASSIQLSITVQKTQRMHGAD